MTDIIKVNNVSKSYGGVKANVDITMTVKQGSITGIIGPNGCGKTTLFNSIVGYHPIDTGNIEFDGQEISKLVVGDIARLGLLRTFQQTRIYTKMNCVDNMQISVSHRKDSKDSIFASRRGGLQRYYLLNPCDEKPIFAYCPHNSFLCRYGSAERF